MNSDRESKAEEIFAEALEMPQEKRREFLEQRCGEDAALRVRIDSLLQAHEMGRGVFGTEGVPQRVREVLNAVADGPPHEGKPGVVNGQTLSHYRLIEKIGAGGMGVVWKAEDTVLNRTVAIKILPADLALDEERRVMFLEEARLAASVSHAHIVQVYEIGREGDLDYIVMEYIDGQPLNKLLHGKPLPPDKVADWGLQVAEGLARAHRKGLIHRDLKPANILVTSDEEVKIVDFGLATLFSPSDAMTGSWVSTLTEGASEEKAKGIAGTLPYMSPEQVRGEKLDARSDIFSFGTVLYEMTTGGRPFQGAGPDRIAAEIQKCQPIPVHQPVPKVPVDLHRIIEKALVRRPGDRYQTMDDLAVDLRRLCKTLDSGSPLSFEDLQRAVVPTRHRPRPWLWSAAGMVGLLIVVAAVWFLQFREPAVEPQQHQRETIAPLPADMRSIAVLPFVNMSEDASNEYFSDGVAEELLSALARVPGLRVTGRTSSFSFKGKNEDLRVIGQKLNVETVLEGSVRKSGNRVRITAQLVKVADGFHLWSENYDRTLDDIFAVQEDIARAVTSALRVTLLESPKVNERVTTDAYALYLQGRFSQADASREGLERAIRYYHQAIALDSTYALAWAWLSLAYGWQASYGEVPSKMILAQAREAAKRALALDPNLAMAHEAMSAFKGWGDWDWVSAAEESDRALVLEPGNSRIVKGAAYTAYAVGRWEEAVARARQAIELDPLWTGAHAGLGEIAWLTGRLDEAEASFKQARELDPGVSLHYSLGVVYLAQERPEAALAEMEQVTRPLFRLAGLALSYHALGRNEEADEALAELIEKHGHTAAFRIATVYAFRGASNDAFKWLDRALDQREPELAEVRGNPLWKNLREDARYTAVLMKIGMPL